MSPLPTVLLVDDLAANRETLGELLCGQGCLLVEASGGAQALELASANPPDLVLLDVMMPEMDGYEVCRRLRADPHLAEVPIIMVTALDDQASRLAGIEAGADDFLSKPLNRLELCARVRTITRLNRYRRLNEQRGQFQWVVELASDGYVIVNAADEILFANPSARLWLGLAPDIGGGDPEQFLVAARRTFLSHPDGSWQGWPDIPAGSLAFPRLLVRPETPQAAAFFLEVSVHENSSGRLLRLCDATGRVAVRRDQRAFQMMVSHKLRTPLNGILGSLEVLMIDRAGVSAAEISEFVLMAHQSAERLNTAVEKVLRFAERSQRPATGTGFALAGLEALARNVAEELGLTSPAVSVDSEARSLAIPCSLEMIEWVLFELLENAKKFHPHQAPAVEVTARLDWNRRVAFTVSDDGVTLSPELLEQASRPFFQGEKYSTSEVPGMGLGLASVFALVWQAGGSCRIRNRTAGTGVSVELHWPCDGLPPDPAAVSEGPGKNRGDERG